MKFRYINGNGEVLKLNDYPYQLQMEPILDYSWNNTTTAIDNRKSTFTDFVRSEKSISLDVVIFDHNPEIYKQASQRLFEVFEKDIVNETIGKLVIYKTEPENPSQVYANEEYLPCFISAGTNKNWQKNFPFNKKQITIISPDPFWYVIKSRIFQKPGDTLVGIFLDYDHDYDYDYMYDIVSPIIWNLEHYDNCDFELKIMGAIENPRLVINDNEYVVYSEIYNGEHLIIDSRDNSIIRYAADGSLINLFNYRGKENSIFKKLSGGKNEITWAFDFTFELKAYLGRSEPKWTQY